MKKMTLKRVYPFQKFIRRMTNWQNSQWLRGGAVPEKAEHFSNLKRGNQNG